jgi:hypothetical protein
MARFLAGSNVAFEIPGLGACPGRNITPDKETGIGNWTLEHIVTALQTGKRPDGRVLAPIMPWHAFCELHDEDAMAIAAFLESVPPVKHEVAGPFRPGEKVLIQDLAARRDGRGSKIMRLQLSASPETSPRDCAQASAPLTTGRPVIMTRTERWCLAAPGS